LGVVNIAGMTEKTSSARVVSIAGMAVMTETMGVVNITGTGGQYRRNGWSTWIGIPTKRPHDLENICWVYYCGIKLYAWFVNNG
jgi:hypothetical protein